MKRVDEKGIKKSLLILGAGQYGFVAKEIAKKTGKYSNISFLDDKSELAIGKLDEIETIKYDEAFVAIGNPEVREKYINKITKIATLIDPKSFISDSAVIGPGCIIEAGAVISTDTKIGKSTIVMANSVVGHNARIGDYCQLKYNSTIEENCIVPSKTKIESNKLYSNKL